MNWLDGALYLLMGLPVGCIARRTGKTRAEVRASLRDAGIIIRPINGSQRGREPVCESVRRLGYKSFHEFAKANSLLPVTKQADLLGTTERAINRIYASYRLLLETLHTIGLPLPTTQVSD